MTAAGHDGWMVELPSSEDPDAAVAQELISRLEYPELLPRAMVAVAPPNEAPAASRRAFSVMQFNLLAEGLSSPPHVTPPIKVKDQQTSAYGGFSSVPNADVVFDWAQRKLRLVQEVLRYLPDLLCVEECDHFGDFLQPALRNVATPNGPVSYDGIFAPKRDSPSLKLFGFYSDGSGILWRTDSFACVHRECAYLPDDDGQPSSRPYVLAALSPLAGGSSGGSGGEGGGEGGSAPILIGATHLAARMGDAAEAERVRQLTWMMDRMQRLREVHPPRPRGARTGSAPRLRGRGCADAPRRPAGARGKGALARGSLCSCPCVWTRGRSGAAVAWCCAATSTRTRTTCPASSARCACLRRSAMRWGCALRTRCRVPARAAGRVGTGRARRRGAAARSRPELRAAHRELSPPARPRLGSARLPAPRHRARALARASRRPGAAVDLVEDAGGRRDQVLHRLHLPRRGAAHGARASAARGGGPRAGAAPRHEVPVRPY